MSPFGSKKDLTWREERARGVVTHRCPHLIHSEHTGTQRHLRGALLRAEMIGEGFYFLKKRLGGTCWKGRLEPSVHLCTHQIFFSAPTMKCQTVSAVKIVVIKIDELPLLTPKIDR